MDAPNVGKINPDEKAALGGKNYALMRKIISNLDRFWS
jgi:hypothetical protein